jgi:thioredoxin reductase (NADPH)
MARSLICGALLNTAVSGNPGIEVHYKTEIPNLEGDTHLERVTWRDKDSLESTTQSIRHVFIMAGASPRTDWLRCCVSLDDKGFILTGRDLGAVKQDGAWPLARFPYMLETSLPRVFAVGDVRSGNVKRVASAVGEGSNAINLVHRALENISFDSLICVRIAATGTDSKNDMHEMCEAKGSKLP